MKPKRDHATDSIVIGNFVKFINSYGSIEINQVYGIGKHYFLTREGEIIFKDEIIAIYKLIDNDYICVWEKEKSEWVKTKEK